MQTQPNAGTQSEEEKKIDIPRTSATALLSVNALSYCTLFHVHPDIGRLAITAFAKKSRMNDRKEKKKKDNAALSPHVHGMRDARQENLHLRGSESSHFRRSSRGLTGNAGAVCTEHSTVTVNDPERLN
jgi:hypothetical protein